MCIDIKFSSINSCSDHNVIPLQAGIAAFGDVPSAIIPASLLMMVLGAFSAYSFYMIPRMTRLDPETKGHKKSLSMSQLWEKEVGQSTSWIVSLCCFLTPLGTALTWSIVLSDMMSMLAQSVGLSGMLVSRQALLLGVTSFALYPLCRLKSLAALSPVSIVGVVGMICTAIFMTLRALPGQMAPFLNSIPRQPSFGLIGNNALSPSALVLVGMCATSLLVHFSAHEFRDDLQNSTPKRFKMLTRPSSIIPH